MLEKEKLLPLRKMAERIIDTSSANVHQLKDIVQRYFLPSSEYKRMIISISSFGYRYGLPADADLVFDVRFLPNPYFVEELKEHDGHNSEVTKFVLKNRESKNFLLKILDLLSMLIPLYDKEGKARLNIAIGCTGGRHRSVVMANELSSRLSKMKYRIYLNHRDIAKS